MLAYSYGYIGMLQMALCFFVFFHAVPPAEDQQTPASREATPKSRSKRAGSDRGHLFSPEVPEMWTMFEHGTFLHVKDFSAADRDHNYRGMTSYYWTLVLAQAPEGAKSSSGSGGLSLQCSYRK